MPDVSHSPPLAEVAAEKASEFLNWPLLVYNGTAYDQGVLLQITCRYLRHRQDIIDATHPPLSTQQMVKGVEDMFKALSAMKEKKEGTESYLHMLRNSIPQLPHILSAIENLPTSTQEETQIKAHMIESIKRLYITFRMSLEMCCNRNPAKNLRRTLQGRESILIGLIRLGHAHTLLPRFTMRKKNPALRHWQRVI